MPARPRSRIVGLDDLELFILEPEPSTAPGGCTDPSTAYRDNLTRAREVCGPEVIWRHDPSRTVRARTCRTQIADGEALIVRLAADLGKGYGPGVVRSHRAGIDQAATDITRWRARLADLGRAR